MKETKLVSMKLVTILILFLIAVPTDAQTAGSLRTQQEKDSYAVGVDLARNLKRRGVEMEADALMRGMHDVLSGAALAMSGDDLRETLRVLQAEERQKMILARQGSRPVADEKGRQGAAFLAQNKTNQGVVCLPDGLQYKVLKPGSGQTPAASDSVECRFRGTLVDGQEFAYSDPKTPVTLKVSELIPGLKEALQLMPNGSKWQIVIPPQLAYGDQGVGRARLTPRIGQNETLIYEVELLAIK